MMRRLLLCIAVLSSCHPVARNTPEEGVYVTERGTDVFVNDGRRSYLGTKYIPPGKNFLRDFGSPITKIQMDGVSCIALSDLTFAVPKSEHFTCNGVNFLIQRKFENGTLIRATCASRRNGVCVEGDSSVPLFQYDYAYVPSRGVEWIRFVSNNPRIPGDVFRYRSGPRILASK